MIFSKSKKNYKKLISILMSAKSGSKIWTPNKLRQ